MRIYFVIWACSFALVQASLAGEAGTPAVEQRTQSFTITLNGSVADVTPLFGPIREAEWAPDWWPRFIQPGQGVQREGAVFTTASGHGKASSRIAHLRLATDAMGRIRRIPICQGLLKTGSWQVLGYPDQVPLRVLHTLVVGQRSNLLEEIFDEESGLNLAQVNLELLSEKTSCGLDYFFLSLLGYRWGHSGDLA